MPGYDFIGDVHGHASKLEDLLGRMGYEPSGDGFRHSERQAVFVGDLIDRGPEQANTVIIARTMVESGAAQIVMGNHEFNAVCWASGFREQSEKNRGQHEEFLDQLSAVEQLEFTGWFATLPLWLRLGGVNVAHACWHEPSIQLLEDRLGGDRFTEVGQFAEAAREDTDVYSAIEVILKGPELDLDEYGLPPFLDSGDVERHDARVRWWSSRGEMLEDLIDRPQRAARSAGPYPEIAGIESHPDDRTFAYSGSTPVIYGHHWRLWEPEEHLDYTAKTACVDFSAGRGGPLVAYRWSGESQIDPRNYVSDQRIPMRWSG